MALIEPLPWKVSLSFGFVGLACATIGVIYAATWLVVAGVLYGMMESGIAAWQKRTNAMAG